MIIQTVTRHTCLMRSSNQAGGPLAPSLTGPVPRALSAACRFEQDRLRPQRPTITRTDYAGPDSANHSSLISLITDRIPDPSSLIESLSPSRDAISDSMRDEGLVIRLGIRDQ